MKLGNLVKFESNSWVFRHANDRYANPGIIIHVEGNRSYQVLWSDQKITSEHASYLHLLEEHCESR